MKRLIVSGDDFGLHPLINQGIIEAHQQGILTSTSVIACGQAVEDAVSLAKQNPKLGVGVHLTFVEEDPVLNPNEIPSLVTSRECFPASWKGFLARFLTGRIRKEELQKETQAQIAKVFDAGIQPTHIDSHQHLHLWPRVWTSIEPVLKKFDIPAARMVMHEMMSDHKGWKSRGLEYLSRRLSSRVQHAGIWYPKYVAGTSLGGHLTSEIVDRLLSHIPTGTTELICHPGKNNRELDSCYHWDYQWEEELAALTSSAISDKIAECNIQLCRFKPGGGIG